MKNISKIKSDGLLIEDATIVNNIDIIDNHSSGVLSLIAQIAMVKNSNKSQSNPIEHVDGTLDVAQTLTKEQFDAIVELAKNDYIHNANIVAKTNLHFDAAYSDDIETFKTAFPNIEINIPIQYLRFQDPEVERILKENFPHEGEAFTLDELSNITSIRLQFQNSEIQYFNELRYFINLTSIHTYAFNGCKKLREVSLPPVDNLDFPDANPGNLTSWEPSLESVFIKDIRSYMMTKVCRDTLHYSLTRPVSNGNATLYIYDSKTPIVDIACPRDVTVVKPNLFYNYRALKSFSGHEELSQIGDSAFFDNINLETVDNIDNVTIIKPFAFANCKKLILHSLPERMEMPSGYTLPTNGIFWNCEKIEISKIPDFITELYGTFNKCRSIKTMDLNNVTVLRSTGYPYLNEYDIYRTGSAFQQCQALTDVKGAKLKVIGEGSFLYCENLQNIKTPEVTKINNMAFKNCTSLRIVDFPKCTLIGEGGYGYVDGAFANCTSLQSASFGKLTKIGANSFFGCNNLTSITFNGTKSEWGAVTLEDKWNNNCSLSVVHCIDGDVSL